jgi:indole-3-glycerol phosphate synthase
MILDEIVAQKKTEVAQLRARYSLDQLRALAFTAPPARDFAAALRAPDGAIRLIAEIKRKSPSRGVFRPNLDAPALARTYADSGAACISVLTDERFFMGTLDDLRAVRNAVNLPLLRKDFVIDVSQIFEARAMGADAVLLIAAILSDGQLAHFAKVTSELGMHALFEVHDEDEVRRVLSLRPVLVGINNRDLRTFRTDLTVGEHLRTLLPPECTAVGESGIHTRADVERLQRAGMQAILVGESLVLAGDTRAQIETLLGVS